jgi:hypothetical protein
LPWIRTISFVLSTENPLPECLVYAICLLSRAANLRYLRISQCRPSNVSRILLKAIEELGTGTLRELSIRTIGCPPEDIGAMSMIQRLYIELLSVDSSAFEKSRAWELPQLRTLSWHVLTDGPLEAQVLFLSRCRFPQLREVIWHFADLHAAADASKAIREFFHQHLRLEVVHIHSMELHFDPSLSALLPHIHTPRLRIFGGLPDDESVRRISRAVEELVLEVWDARSWDMGPLLRILATQRSGGSKLCRIFVCMVEGGCSRNTVDLFDSADTHPDSVHIAWRLRHYMSMLNECGIALFDQVGRNVMAPPANVSCSPIAKAP